MEDKTKNSVNDKFNEETKNKVEEYLKTHNVDQSVLDVVTAVTGYQFEDKEDEE